MTTERFRMTIGGQSVDAATGRTFESQNPYTGAPWAVVPEGGPEDVEAGDSAARSAQGGKWRNVSGFERATLMRGLGDLVLEDDERLARLEVLDYGRLFREMID